ncbi:MAG: DEAD/DEAH box helicase family protein [Christensenellales bacterium]
MTNFSFLETAAPYSLFAPACIEAERVLAASPAMSAVGSRKALELAVKWVYAADNSMSPPYRDNLQALIHEPSFRYAVDARTWSKLPYLVKLGNLAVHTERRIDRGEAVLALQSLFEFIQWLDYCYGADYKERRFDEALIPREMVLLDEQRIREQESLLQQRDQEVQALQQQVAQLSQQYTAAKAGHQQQRSFNPDTLSEYATRKRYIDVDLKTLGWVFGESVLEEVEVTGMMGIPGQLGKVDYVLYDKDRSPLALIEVKRSSADSNKGRQQAKLYADCLEAKHGRRPMMFLCNGFDTWFWDDTSAPPRRVSGVFSQGDLQKLMLRRRNRKPLSQMPINNDITGRYYQLAAIRAVCDSIEQGARKSLLVMATGTGKTRTAISLTDLLSRAGHVTNILFLADRTALVSQAHNEYKKHLPDLSLCNLLSNKDDRHARVVFSTYPTMLNAIDSARNEDNSRLFTPAHFDLIIIDEAHRSIFRKYGNIFDYFDALLVGLTATPKTDVDRNTYDFFELEQGVPTFAYEYETAVYEDHFLVPYHNIEVSMKFLEEGIVYDDLSEEEKRLYEEEFAEDDGIPDRIPPADINRFIFNRDTVDTVLENLMQQGIKVKGGEHIGKSIIFAQNRHHAQFIVERFDKLYPHFHGRFARRIVHDDAYAHNLIDEFKRPDQPPWIAVSVDMLDTGIDVPEIVNLVYFKKVRSKTKFWQMLGRGTRLCPGLECIDGQDGPYTDKRRFYIFDYLGNFDYFRAEPRRVLGSPTESLAQSIFIKRVRLIQLLQSAQHMGYHAWREELIHIVWSQIKALNQELTSVRLQRQYVDRYSDKTRFQFLHELDRQHLSKYISPLVFMTDEDESAKRFDNLLYGLINSRIMNLPEYMSYQKRLKVIAQALEGKSTIPQVMEQMPLIQALNSEAFWDIVSLDALENVRKRLRGLIQFIDGPDPRSRTETDFMDAVTAIKEGDPLGAVDDYRDYRLKVTQYIQQNKDHIAIHKLTHNLPLTAGDYQSLSDILTKQLGSKEDYKKHFQELPFGLLVRKIAKLDHQAALQAFSEFINDQQLNHQQIEYVRKVINYIEHNGYMENVKALMEPPFDRPMGLMLLFDQERQRRLIQIVNSIRDNAVELTG